MKVLALYDIHGNVDALEAVLADPKAAGPDAVVIGGDAVPGPFAAATLDRLQRLEAPVHVVRGNGEREVGEAVGGEVRFVNAGSVGLPYEGDGAARWLWVADGRAEPQRTPYDAAGAGRRMLAAGWPDARSIEAALIAPVEPIVVTRLFEELASAA
jgi:hypothetical protein